MAIDSPTLAGIPPSATLVPTRAVQAEPEVDVLAPSDAPDVAVEAVEIELVELVELVTALVPLVEVPAVGVDDVPVEALVPSTTAP